MKKLAILLSLLMVFSFSGSVAAFGLPSMQTTTISNSLQIVGDTTPDVCARYTNHIYEVCSAYVANCTLAVLVPYYKYANSSNDALRRYATYRLGSRYYGNANNLLRRRVDAWPAGSHDVAVPDIRIVSAQSSLATNTATLETQESWTVRDASGRIVYQEINVRHTVTLQRVPGYLLHKWVVTDIR